MDTRFSNIQVAQVFFKNCQQMDCLKVSVLFQLAYDSFSATHQMLLRTTYISCQA